jgi:hypothetical protein
MPTDAVKIDEQMLYATVSALLMRFDQNHIRLALQSFVIEHGEASEHFACTYGSGGTSLGLLKQMQDSAGRIFECMDEPNNDRDSSEDSDCLPQMLALVLVLLALDTKNGTLCKAVGIDMNTTDNDDDVIDIDDEIDVIEPHQLLPVASEVRTLVRC